MIAKQISSPVLNKSWIIIEKIIAIALAIWGMYSLYNVVAVIADMINSGYAGKMGTSYWQLFSNNHLAVLLSLLSIFGGFFLFFNKKAGWVLCLLSSAMYGISFFVSSRMNAMDTKLPFTGYYKSYGIAALIFIVLFVVLLLKHFREKYQPTLKDWSLLLSLLLLLIADKVIF